MKVWDGLQGGHGWRLGYEKGGLKAEPSSDHCRKCRVAAPAYNEEVHMLHTETRALLLYL